VEQANILLITPAWQTQTWYPMSIKKYCQSRWRNTEG